MMDEEIGLIQIAEQLKVTSSREEGRIILNKYKTMKQLKVLAKYLRISIRNLSKDSVVEKIIQETIGHRIDSMIIQNHKWEE